MITVGYIIIKDYSDMKDLYAFCSHAKLSERSYLNMINDRATVDCFYNGYLTFKIQHQQHSSFANSFDLVHLVSNDLHKHDAMTLSAFKLLISL